MLKIFIFIKILTKLNVEVKNFLKNMRGFYERRVTASKVKKIR